MKTVLLLTHRFPYFGGEEFLETEISYWGNSPARVIILPLMGDGSHRAMPRNVLVEEPILSSSGAISIPWSTVRILFSALVWREFWHVAKARRMRPSVVARVLKEAARTHRVQAALGRVIDKVGSAEVVYAYWNDATSYGAVLFKEQLPGRVGSVVSRAHRFDLYENSHRDGYLPFKRQLLRRMDCIYPVSADGLAYLRNTYRTEESLLRVSRLGVELPMSTARTGDSTSLYIVSISLCKPVKRIDLIIEALTLFAESNPEIRISWTHIGGGDLLEGLMWEAEKRLRPVTTVDFEFVGHRRNAEVFDLLLTRPVDLLLNVSTDEGVPVSIMEAMSCGVPAVAPDVGGMRELVSAPWGRLMSSTPTSGEVAQFLRRFAKECKDAKVRDQARGHVLAQFNASVNYPQFISSLLENRRYD